VGLEGLRSIRGVIGRSNVRHLDLSNNFLDDEGAVEIAGILRVPSKLTSLSIAKNPITSLGIAHIAEALKGNSRITSLDVSFTNIGPSGASMLFEALRDENSAIRYLDVSHCGIQDDGAADLGRMLRRHKTLETLAVEMNEISEDGSEALMRQLKHNSVLRKLSYGSGNVLSPRAADDFAEYLGKESCSLTILHLDNGVMGPAAVIGLMAGVERSRSLVELNLKGNDLSKCANHVFSAVARNTFLK
jgi:Ran GTPase-activating protein (RanGAP) involved in mRNA processing and transport